MKRNFNSREKHFVGLQNETGNALYISFSKFLCFAPGIQDSPILNFRDLTKFKVETNETFDPTRQLNSNKIPWPESFICSGFTFIQSENFTSWACNIGSWSNKSQLK